MAAATVITNTQLSLNKLVKAGAGVAVEATNGAIVTYAKADQKVVVIATNSNVTTAYDVTVKKGNGLQGVADYKVEVPATETWAGIFESGAFVNVSGTNKGKMVIIGEAADVTIAVYLLP